MKDFPIAISLLFALLSPVLLPCSGDSTGGVEDDSPATVCIVGSGIGGSSVAHFLRNYSVSTGLNQAKILMFERHEIVGGRMRTVTVAGDTFEAGGSILHPKNYHVKDFVERFNLTVRLPTPIEESSAIGIWDGKRFVVKTFGSGTKFPFLDTIVSWVNDLYLFLRYGLSLLRMSSFIENTVDNFLKYYESLESRPIFDNVEGMLKWSGLYNLTKLTLQEKLSEAQLSPLLVNELVTVIFLTILSFKGHFNLFFAYMVQHITLLLNNFCQLSSYYNFECVYCVSPGYYKDKLWTECTHQWVGRCCLFGGFRWRIMVC
jgi:prenylcysteine oxidase/farnesylcysteine lyase